MNTLTRVYTGHSGLLWNNVSWQVPFLWQTKSLTYFRHCCSTHTCPGLKNRYNFKMFTLLSWSKMPHLEGYSSEMYNSLHSWHKLPSTLTTYHTAYLFSFTLPWYVAYSRPRILAQLQLRRERVKIYLYNRVATENSHVQFYDVTSWNYVNKDDPVLFARGNGLYISVY